MNKKQIIDNRGLFLAYGILNVVLLIGLVIILILFFNDIYVVSRTMFVLFVGIHLFLLFFVKVHYLSVSYDSMREIIDFQYSKKYHFKKKDRTRNVTLALSQFDGYKIEKDALGLITLTFYKLENKERFALGPFHVGFVSTASRKLLIDTFGESL